MFNIFSSQTKPYKNLSGRGFRNALENSNAAILLDVRTAGEFQSGSLPGAVNIDILSTEFETKTRELGTEAEYFVFCRSGARSAQACAILSEMGIKANNLISGISAWPE